MAGEMEDYLLNKFGEAVEELKPSEQYLLYKLVPLDTQFKKLKQLLQENGGTYPAPAAEVSNPRRSKLYYLINVWTDWLIVSKNQTSLSPDTLYFAATLNRNLKKIRKELGPGDAGGAPERAASLQMQPRASLPGTSEAYPFRWSTGFVDPDTVHGLEDKLLYIERMLVQQERKDLFTAIGMVGLRGVGKTTLCQLLYNREKVRERFCPMIWVCMSKQPTEDEDNRKEIVKRMLVCLGVEEERIDAADQSHGLPGLLCALRLELRGKRYLVVLDDAWNSNEFFYKLEDFGDSFSELLANGLPKGNGGVVIVTSRDKKIAENMVGEEQMHSLVPLSDPESCWLIFQDSVKKEGEEFPTELEREDIKGEIVKACAGLPLAAKMMGQIMHHQIYEENSAAAQNNQQHDHNQQQPIGQSSI